jgi:O-antigen/teichoic acid export membrane protein
MHLDRESAQTAAEPLPSPAAALLELDAPQALGRSLSRDSVLFGLGTLAGKGIGFLVLPIFARLLAPAQFGELDVLNALVSSGLLIVMLGTDVAAVRLYFDRSTDRERRQLFATWASMAILVAAVPTIGLIASSDAISSFLFGSPDLGLAVVFAGVALLAGAVHFVTLGILRATGRPAVYAALEGSALIVNAALAVALLIVWRADATSVMLALAVSWSAVAIIGLVTVRDRLVARPTTLAAKAILVLALPLAPAIAATWGADFFHRAYLLDVSGATQVAYLSVATRIGSVAMLVVAAAQLAWHPHAYRLGVSDDATARLATEGRQIVVALVACVGALAVVTPELLVVIGGDQYRAAAPTVGLFLVSVVGVGLFTIGSLPSAIERRTADMGVAIVAGVTVAVVANVLVGAAIGAPGTAAAIALGQFVTAAIAIRLGRQRLSIPFEWVRLLALVGLVVIVALLATSTVGLALIARLGLGLVLAIGLALEGTLPTWLATAGRRRRPSADA